MKVTDNTIFISGSSAGIGFEIAKAFSEKGNKVIINGRNQERLEKALGQLNNAFAIQGDLSIESERIRIAEELKKTHPDINLIVNNAGEAFAYNLGESNGKSYEYSSKEIITNYTSIIHFTDLLLSTLKEKPEATVVNITSIVSLLPTTGVPTYSSSKAALHFYTQALRMSLSQTSIKVFEVIPPLVNTEFSADIGGANGIPAGEVAEELVLALENNQFDVPVGQSKTVFAVFKEAIEKLVK